MSKDIDIKEIARRIRQFRDERNWRQFHNPKNMACSIVIEAAELLEIFQWKNMEQSKEAAHQQHEEISDEIADIAIYLIGLAETLDMDLIDCIERKIAKNAAKYPVEKAKGNSNKYTEI